MKRIRSAVAGVAMLAAPLALLAAPAANASPAPTPPFNQCPAVGLDSSCALLLVINPDGTVVAYGDPAQGPFDGIEDTLVGVQNNSGVTVPSLTLSGPGAFSFDGDGICSGFFSGTPAGCPFGPTGYEGPNTSFTVIDGNNGIVNFTGGLAPGGSAYFSLEEIITANNIVIVPPNRPPVCSAATVDKATLWPPDHTLRNVTISGVTDPDAGDTVTINVTSVTSDEPTNGLGDGDTPVDAVITPNSNVVQLRAERSGKGDGRVYVVNFTATDSHGGTCTGSVTVTVLHDQKPGSVAVNSGQRYNATI